MSMAVFVNQQPNVTYNSSKDKVDIIVLVK